MRWSFGSKTKKQTLEQTVEGLVGIYETPKSLSIAYGVGQGEDFVIKAQLFQSLISGDAGIKQVALQRFVQANQLQGVACVYVLGAGEYSLHLVEAPAVASQERSQAVSWLIRDLVSFPIEEAVIDTFELPFPRARDNLNMLYAVVMRKTQIASIEGFTHASGLVLTYIDIPELALKNILNLDPKYTAGCAFVQLHAQGGRLMLCQDNSICMIRSFDLTLDNLASEEGLKSLESLCLEIHRSFDYVNSMFRKNISNTVVLAPTFLNIALIQESIKNTLGFEVNIFDPCENLKTEKPMSDEEKTECLCAIGTLLKDQDLKNDSADKPL